MVVVSHVSPVKAAVGWALDVGPEVAWRTFVAPGSITRLGVGPTGPVLRGFNETAHLPADLTTGATGQSSVRRARLGATRGGSLGCLG